MLSTNYPLVLKDQLGNQITFPNAPNRIISLVPSITLTLFDLGLQTNIVGRTKFCIHPKDSIKQIPQIGGTKNLNFSKIENLKPDLIIANKEENSRAQIELLQSQYNVWISDINDLDTNYEMLLQIGKLTNTLEKAQNLIDVTQTNFEQLNLFNREKVAYFIWRRPFMVAGKDTFINYLLEKLNLVNCFSDSNSRYPEIDANQLQESQPQFIFLSSEPYPFKDIHIKELQLICPKAKIILVDGELFSWHGSKIIESPPYFNRLINALTS